MSNEESRFSSFPDFVLKICHDILCQSYIFGKSFPYKTTSVNELNMLSSLDVAVTLGFNAKVDLVDF